MTQHYTDVVAGLSASGLSGQNPAVFISSGEFENAHLEAVRIPVSGTVFVYVYTQTDAGTGVDTNQAGVSIQSGASLPSLAYPICSATLQADGVTVVVKDLRSTLAWRAGDGIFAPRK